MARSRYTILSMMKDEGPWLLEWVAYHRLIGFDNICVYTNDCSDGTELMLRRLEELGQARHFENQVPKDKKPQPNALRLATRNSAVTNTDWLVALDADEFVAIKPGNGQVTDLFSQCPAGTDAIMATWRVFGSDGAVDWGNGLITQTLCQAAPDDFRKGWGVKTLFRPFEGMKLGIHRPQIVRPRQNPEAAARLLGQTWVNGSGRVLPEEVKRSAWRSTEETLGYDLVEINHYAVRSREAYLLRQLRGNVNNKPDKYDTGYFAIFDRNEVHSPTVARHAPAVRAAIDRLLEDRRLAKLLDDSRDYHAGQVDRMKRDGSYSEAMAALEVAAAVPYEKLDEVLFTGHLPKVWRERIAELRGQGVSDKDLALYVARGIATHEARQRGEKP